jgi:Rrf2 family protein
MLAMHVSAKVDYGMRALLVIAREASGPGVLIKGDRLAAEQRIPGRFLEGILRQLRQAGIIVSQRGADGGYRLARPAQTITVADVFRALDGPLADVRGGRPEDTDYTGAAEHLGEVWIATRAALRGVLDHVTLADIASGELPEAVKDLTRNPAAWS